MKDLDIEKIIEAYENGQSLNSIAKEYNTYATSISRLLKKHDVKLRHDSIVKGEAYVKDGEKLIGWAQAQDRPVTKSELAKVIGQNRLSPSYFEKYPTLGRYIKGNMQKEFEPYFDRLCEWLTKHDIGFKLNDRTKIGMSLSVLLFGEYSNIAFELNMKPKSMSTRAYDIRKFKKKDRAREAEIFIIWLNESLFKEDDFMFNDKLRRLLNSAKIKMGDGQYW